jgi:thioredoxin reductase (NADPH)
MYPEHSLYEMVIVGAGPAGISMAVEAVEQGIAADKIVLLEKSEDHSYSIRKFYPDNKLVTSNYKGHDVTCIGRLCIGDLSKKDTLDYLDGFIKDYALQVKYKHSVEEIQKLRNGQYVVCSGNECFVSKTVCIAIGVLGRPNKPSYPIPSGIVSKVFYDVTTKEFSGKSVLVVGGGDSASEYAQFLYGKGNKVSFSYRRESITRMNDANKKALEEMADKGHCKLMLGTDIEKLEDLDGQIGVHFKDGSLQKYDHIVYALGGTTPENFLKSIGIKMTKEGPEVSNFFESGQEGLFILGDLSAGKGGGSINLAFNNSHRAMGEICSMYLDCKK